MNFAHIIDRFTDSILRFLEPASNELKRKPAGGSNLPIKALGEGPQEVCRLLDKSQDLAEEYSRPCDGRTSHTGVGAQSQGGTPALPVSKVSGRVGSRKESASQKNLAAPKTLDSSDPIVFRCEQTVETAKVYECDEKAIGICANCHSPVCAECLRVGWCWNGDFFKHRVSLQ